MKHVTYQRAAEIIRGFGVLGFETQMGNPLSRHFQERIRKGLLLSHVNLYNASKHGLVRLSVRDSGALIAEVVLFASNDSSVLSDKDVDNLKSLFEMVEMINEDKFIVVESRSEREI